MATCTGGGPCDGREKGETAMARHSLCLPISEVKEEPFSSLGIQFNKCLLNSHSTVHKIRSLTSSLPQKVFIQALTGCSVVRASAHRPKSTYFSCRLIPWPSWVKSGKTTSQCVSPSLYLSLSFSLPPSLPLSLKINRWKKYPQVKMKKKPSFSARNGIRARVATT